MTLERVKHTMERLKMQHTLGTLPELVEEAVKRKEGPLAFLDRVVTLGKKRGRIWTLDKLAA